MKLREEFPNGEPGFVKGEACWRALGVYVRLYGAGDPDSRANVREARKRYDQGRSLSTQFWAVGVLTTQN